jgi:hypothetical protein
MQRLSRAVTRGAVGVEPLPALFASWDERRIRFYPKNVHMIGGRPGSYKTTVALNAIVNLGLPTLGFSNDSDDLTVASRLLAMSTGRTTEQTEDWINTDPAGAGVALQRFDFLAWNFLPNPTLDDVWLETYAYAETHGSWPRVILIDILKNVSAEFGDEWSSLREVMIQSLVLARETEAAVVLVHHASDGARGRPVPSRADILGKVGALPAVMVNVGMDDNNDLWVAGVKVRKARSDPDARDPFRMTVRPECAQVTDYIPIPRSPYGGWNSGGGDDFR